LGSDSGDHLSQTGDILPDNGSNSTRITAGDVAMCWSQSPDLLGQDLVASPSATTLGKNDGMRSYDYARRAGVRELSWDDCAVLAQRLAEDLGRRHIEVIIGVARGGLFPAVEVAMGLQTEFFPARLTRRVAGAVRSSHPIWRTPVTADVAGQHVAVIDEIADSGESLDQVRRAALDLGATSVVTACLVSHTWADPSPDIVALTSDELIIFPWGRQIYRDGTWRLDPELEHALRQQQAE
jgi:hypoxanthine phosphoribosyltransferase